MKIPEFSPDEMKVVAEIPDMFRGPSVPVFNTPVTAKEAVHALFDKKPVWQVMMAMGTETKIFGPCCNPDNVARASVFDGTVVPGVTNLSGGKDIFGIEWEYIPAAMGCMVRPGKPFISDASELSGKVVWPDIDSWDWEGCRKANAGYFSAGTAYSTMLLNGYFERLISFMDFEGAILALSDEDQQDAIKAFFEKLTDFYIVLVDRHLKHFPEIDNFLLHDDWAAQKDTFFSPALCREMIVPHMKRLTAFVHSKGRSIELHSCGNNIKQVPNMIAAGFDSWCPQGINDVEKIYDLYGDQIIIGTLPQRYDVDTASEEEQRAVARAYADKYCRPDKPSYLSMHAAFPKNLLTRAFREELYRQSRINYSKA
jgi:hypothetical protein